MLVKKDTYRVKGKNIMIAVSGSLPTAVLVLNNMEFERRFLMLPIY